MLVIFLYVITDFLQIHPQLLSVRYSVEFKCKHKGCSVQSKCHHAFVLQSDKWVKENVIPGVSLWPYARFEMLDEGESFLYDMLSENMRHNAEESDAWYHDMAPPIQPDDDQQPESWLMALLAKLKRGDADVVGKCACPPSATSQV